MCLGNEIGPQTYFLWVRIPRSCFHLVLSLVTPQNRNASMLKGEIISPRVNILSLTKVVSNRTVHGSICNTRQVTSLKTESNPYPEELSSVFCTKNACTRTACAGLRCEMMRRETYLIAHYWHHQASLQCVCVCVLNTKTHSRLFIALVGESRESERPPYVVYILCTLSHPSDYRTFERWRTNKLFG